MFGWKKGKRRKIKFKKIEQNQHLYFEWIHECATLLRVDGTLILNEAAWKHAHHCGLSPEQAVEQYNQVIENEKQGT